MQELNGLMERLHQDCDDATVAIRVVELRQLLEAVALLATKCFASGLELDGDLIAKLGNIFPPTPKDQCPEQVLKRAVYVPTPKSNEELERWDYQRGVKGAREMLEAAKSDFPGSLQGDAATLETIFRWAQQYDKMNQGERVEWCMNHPELVERVQTQWRLNTESAEMCERYALPRQLNPVSGQMLSSSAPDPEKSRA